MSIGTPSLPSPRIGIAFRARPAVHSATAREPYRAERRHPRLGILLCLAFSAAFWGGLAAALLG